MTIYRSIQLSTRASADSKRLAILGAVLSSSDPDEHRSVVLPGGVTARHPSLPLIVDHRYEVDSVIGRVENVRAQGTGRSVLLGDLRFEDSSRGRELFERVLNGTLTDLSIGFVAVRTRPPTEAEAKLGVEEVIEKARLVEVSLVAVGSNPTAQIAVAARALCDETTELCRSLSASGSSSGERSLEDVASEIESLTRQAELMAIGMDLTSMRFP